MRSLHLAQKRLKQSKDIEARVRQRQQKALQSQRHEQQLQSKAIGELNMAQHRKHRCYAYLARLLKDSSKGVLELSPRARRVGLPSARAWQQGEASWQNAVAL